MYTHHHVEHSRVCTPTRSLMKATANPRTDEVSATKTHLYIYMYMYFLTYACIHTTMSSIHVCAPQPGP